MCDSRSYLVVALLVAGGVIGFNPENGSKHESIDYVVTIRATLALPAKLVVQGGEVEPPKPGKLI